MNLFEPVVPVERQHTIFRILLEPGHQPERDVLTSWSDGFIDRDGKFVKEFQTTFESSFWELYLYAVLRELGMRVDFSFHAPDFVVTAPTPFLLEATIAAPAKGAPTTYGTGRPEIPGDFSEFNRQAILRVCNSFTGKARRYRDHYAALPHVQDLPFVIAIAPFDRPHAHLAANRSIVAALYGIYYDEDATIDPAAEQLVSYGVDAVTKNDTASVPVGMFANEAYSDVSAVIYGPLATWGKVRALADAPQRNIEFTTLHPSSAPGLVPELRRARKADYVEHLLDGLYVLHNPFAKRPLASRSFDHDRLARFEVRPDGAVEIVSPDDFLLMRILLNSEPRAMP